MAGIEPLPVAPDAIRDGVLAELEHISALVSRLSPGEWSHPSAVKGRTVGDVAAHLDLFVGLYSRFLGGILRGGGSGGMVKAIGWLTSSIMPSAAPVFDTINGTLPRVVRRLLPAERLKGQFAAGAHNVGARLRQVGPADYTRPVYFEGGPYPFSFYLAIIINELAIHGWDIESAIQEAPDLSEAASGILPWFYWSATRLMFRPPRGTGGTVQVLLSHPELAMWWSVDDDVISLGRGTTGHAAAEIRGPSRAYVLAIAGRIRSYEALRSSLVGDGDRALAERFLTNWHLI